jgi:leucyl/phenylalanyl-tRNA--protein transferase
MIARRRGGTQAAGAMPVYRLDKRIAFPDPNLAGDDSLLAVGGDLSTPRLLLAYQYSIFPWYSEGQPILWHSPPWRLVVTPESLHVGRTTQKWMRRGVYELRYDTAFERVMRACGEAPRPGQDGTWVTEAMVRAYTRLHREGFAHSAEAWLDGELVGGLYGVTLGAVFFGESMFSRRDNASKVVFGTLAPWLFANGYRLIDSQVHTEHVERFGGFEIDREDYLERLHAALRFDPAFAWPS